MEFETLEAYLEAYRTDRELGIIPIPLVAEYLEKSAPAVSAMVRANTLREIRIGKSRFISVQSLFERKKKFDDDCDVVERFLIRQIQQGKTSLFYEPVMAQIGLSTSVPADRTKIGQILGEISEKSNKAAARDRCMLSVIVHRSTAGTTRPGPGFFNLAATLGYEWDDDDAFVRRQTDRVMRRYGD